MHSIIKILDLNTFVDSTLYRKMLFPYDVSVNAKEPICLTYDIFFFETMKIEYCVMFWVKCVQLFLSSFYSDYVGIELINILTHFLFCKRFGSAKKSTPLLKSKFKFDISATQTNNALKTLAIFTAKDVI